MKRCLIVVDFQNDFVTGSLGFSKAEEITECIAGKIREYRRSGDDILFTFDTHHEDYLSTQEGRNLPIVHCVKGTEGHKLHPAIEALRQPEDICFEKFAFGSSDLMDYMREHMYSSIELCGLVSNICVLSNAVICKAAQPETPVSVDIRCTAAADETMNEAALLIMKGIQIELKGRDD